MQIGKRQVTGRFFSYRGGARAFVLWLLVAHVQLAESQVRASQIDAQNAAQREHRLQSGLIYSIANSARWVSIPESRIQCPMILCLSPEISFFNEIFQELFGKKINGRILVLVPYEKREQLPSCEIFVTNDLGSTSPDVIKAERILTIGVDGADDRKNGIRITKSNNRLELLVNESALEEAGIIMSKEFMELTRRM